MKFCDCGSYLFKKEIINKENKKELNYYCKCCDYQDLCDDYKIYSKIYKNNNMINNDKEINKLKINDKTLPEIKIKCKKCKKTNENKYEIHYTNNSYHRNIICKKCYTNWLK